MNAVEKMGALFIALLTLPGCFPSLNPVYRDQDLIFDETVLGAWVQPDNKAQWNLSRLDDKSYRLVYTNEGGQKSRFIARVAKIDGTRFLDLSPEDVGADVDGFYRMHLVPIHTIYLVCETEKNLELAAINYEWLDQYLREHPEALQSVTFNDQRLVTAPTEEVQAFVVKHKEMFVNKIVLQRATQNVN